MAAKLSYCRLVAVFVVAACAIASAFPFQPSHDAEYRPQQEHKDASTSAEHGEAAGDGSHKPGSTYHFQYAVHDPLTGDEKSQNEVGDGHGSVKGTYSLVEPDGSTRVVEYTADDVHGFRAEVKRIEPAHRQQHHVPSPSASAPSYKQFDFAAEHATAAPSYKQFEFSDEHAAAAPSYKQFEFSDEHAAAAPSYKQFDFAPKHAVAAPSPVDFEQQQSLNYNYQLQEHQPELQHHFSSSHR